MTSVTLALLVSVLNPPAQEPQQRGVVRELPVLSLAAAAPVRPVETAFPSLEGALTLEARSLPPAPWAPADTADALYRRARELMSDGQHREAAEIFRTIWSQHGSSEYASDAPYWEAFNLYRAGGEPNLRRALESLRVQAGRFASATTVRNGEARTLETRIQGMLAETGDEAAARAVSVLAETAVVAVSQARESVARSQAVQSATRARLEQARSVTERRREELPPGCDEEEVEIKRAALNALVGMGPTHAVPVFRDVVESDDPCAAVLRRSVPILLARSGMRSEEAIGLLLELARSQDEEVAGRALTYLGQTDDPRALAYLEEVAVSGSVERRSRALSGLARSGGPEAARVFRTVAADRSAPEDLRASAITHLTRMDDGPPLGFFRELYANDPALRVRVVRAARGLDDPAVLPWLLEVAADEGAEEDVRKAALYAAGRRDDGLDRLLALYPRLPPSLKGYFIYSVSSRDEPEALDFIIEVARSEEDPDLRKTAIQWLGRSRDPRAVQVLREIIGG